jgi:hypothetical protein
MLMVMVMVIMCVVRGESVRELNPNEEFIGTRYGLTLKLPAITEIAKQDLIGRLRLGLRKQEMG